MSTGSHKGSGFERWQCRFLSLWWSAGEDPDVFWRNRTRKKKGMELLQYGDVMAAKPEGMQFTEVFNVELKKGYSKRGRKGHRLVPWDLLDTIDYVETKARKQPRSSVVIMDFWQQCSRDARLSNRLPMLIFQRDYHVAVVCMRVSDVINMASTGCTSKTFTSVMDDLHAMPCVYMNEPGAVDNSSSSLLVFYRQESFFEWLKPAWVRKYHKKWVDRYKMKRRR